MTLQEFIKTALVEIASGVESAQCEAFSLCTGTTVAPDTIDTIFEHDSIVGIIRDKQPLFAVHFKINLSVGQNEEEPIIIVEKSDAGPVASVSFVVPMAYAQVLPGCGGR